MQRRAATGKIAVSSSVCGALPERLEHFIHVSGFEFADRNAADDGRNVILNVGSGNTFSADIVFPITGKISLYDELVGTVVECS